MKNPTDEDNEERCEMCGTNVGLALTNHGGVNKLLCDGCDGLITESYGDEDAG
jgi:hypothetical protein